MTIEEGVPPRSSNTLKKELEASQAKIILLEKENQGLTQEVARLRAQLNSYRVHDIDRKSAFRSQDKQMILPMQKTEQQKVVLEKLVAKEHVLKSAAKRENEETFPKQQPLPLKPTTSSQKEASLDKMLTPPPPPPLPSKLLLCGPKAIRRVPEVIEFYRSLMKKDAQKENNTSSLATNLPILHPKDMIGEIENRSTYLLNIKSDVESYGKLISFLSKEIEGAAFGDISEVETFVKWVDGELSCLVDERAVLKNFPQWPERKADALKEASCSYRDLKSLKTEVLSYKDSPNQQLIESLRKMQALQDRIERSLGEFERVREGTMKKYRDLQIPWSWMLDTGLIGQIKFSSLTLAKQYMKRITKELTCHEASQDDHLLLQAVRFAYRIHQYAGGFDMDTMRAFEELKRIGKNS